MAENSHIMAENSHISWTTHTFNTHWGCTKVSAGCKHCYAETLSERFAPGVWGPSADRRPMSEAYWKQLSKWQRKAEQSATNDEHPPSVFCNSMSDLFEGPETCQDPTAYAVVKAGRERLFEAIERTPLLRYLLLTKRSENLLRFAPARWAGGWPENVMAGASVENQEMADKRIFDLLQVPARRFLSVEPLLGPTDLTRVGPFNYPFHATAYRNVLHPAPLGPDPKGNIHWVIVGGESGQGARPVEMDWVRRLRDDCITAGVPFHFKQWGGVNKKTTGRELDGRTWDEVPELNQ